MIPNQWYAVLESNEVLAGGGRRDALREPLVFWRTPAVTPSACATLPHRGAALSIGRCSRAIECPFHGFTSIRRAAAPSFRPTGGRPKCEGIPGGGLHGA